MMFSELWKALARKYIACDVPDEMAACFDCNVVRCLGDKYETCPNRLTLAAALKARATNEAPAAGPATTGL